MPGNLEGRVKNEYDRATVKLDAQAMARFDTKAYVAITAVLMFGLPFCLRWQGATDEAITQVLIAAGIVILVWQIGMLREFTHVMTAIWHWEFRFRNPDRQ